MSEYVLGDTGESKRLSFQSMQRNYDPLLEVGNVELLLGDGQIALDAGCGTGLFAHRISEVNNKKDISVIGLDSSYERIREAREGRTIPGLIFQVGDLTSLDFDSSSIDLIVCRFVYEHLKDNCQKVSDEFFRVLKPKGKLIIIDSDGILYNLDSENEVLKRYLSKIQKSTIHFDSFICKKVPRFLQRSGFSQEQIKTKGSIMSFFEKEDREYEKKLWNMRFKQIEPVIAPILGTEEYQNFTKLYISELMNMENYLYYSKHVFTAVKSEN